MIAKSRDNSYFHKLKVGIFLSFIFILTSCKFLTNTINVKTNAHSFFTISVKILNLVGSIASNDRSSMLISTAQASACANPVYAKLFKLATDGSINEAAPIDSQLVGASATYSFDAKALSLSSNTNVDYMVIASGCNDVVYKRPVTNFDKYQDIDEKSSLVASVVNANGLVGTNLNQAQRGDIDVLIKSISGTTVAALVASADNSAKFTQIFGVAPTVIEDAKPDIILTMPTSTINELATSTFTAESFHMDSSYPIVYSWKVDGVAKSATHILSYIPGANDSGFHQIVLLAGKDDGSGGIDLTKPYYTKTFSISVQNNILPTAPNIAINALTPSPRNATSVDIDVSTGATLANCASFSHLAFTETNSAPGVMQFNINCTTAGTQTETVSFSSGDGAKTLYIWAIDGEGNISSPKSVSLVLDTLPPTASMSLSSTLFKGGSSTSVTLAASDSGAGMASLDLYFAADGSTYSLLSHLGNSDTSYSWTVPSINTSAGKLKLLATDLTGSVTTIYSSTLTIDSTAPTSPSFSISSANPTSSSAVSVTVSSCSDVAQVLLVESNTQPTGSESGWANCSTSAGAHTVTISGNSLHTLYLWSKDAAGNISLASTSNTVTLDTVAPVIASGPTIASSMNKGGTSTSITWSLTDTTTATVELLYSTNNGSTFTSIASGLANSGTYSWTIPTANSSTVKLKLVATDQVGLSSNATGSAFTIDSTAPTVAITTPTGPLKGGATITLNYSATDANTISSLQLFYAADGSTFGAPTSLTVGSTSVSWSVPSSDLATAKLKVTATDAAGNSASAVSSAFTIDSTAPTSPSFTISSANPTSSSIISATVSSCSDADQILLIEANTQPTGIESGWANCSTSVGAHSITISGDGAHTVYLWSKDAAGNIALASTSQSVTLDTTAPVIASGPSIASAMNKGGASTSITWSLTDTTTATVELLYSTNNGSTFTSIASGLTNNGTYSWTIPAADSSTVKLKLVATDQLGFSSNATGEAFTIDSTAPAVAITTPTGPLKGGVTVALSYSATDTNTISSLQLSYAADGSTFGAPTSLTVGSTSVTWNIPSSDLATAKLKVTATDAAGNSASAVTSAFTIDSTAPTLSITAPTNASSTYATSITVSGSCSEDSRVVSVSVSDGTTTSAPVSNPNCSSGSYTSSVDISGLAIGSLTVTATHGDAATNSTSQSVTISHIVPPPTKLILSGSTSTTSGTCTQYTIQTQNASSVASAVTQNTTINLSLTGSGALYSNNTCTSAITSLQISTGASSGSFYYLNRDRETGISLTISDGTSSLTSASITGISSNGSIISIIGDNGSIGAGCVIQSGGSVWCWASYISSDPGYNGVIAPLPIEGLGKAAVQVSRYGYYSCAVLSDGSIKCWGANNNGNLGDGTTTGRSTPVTVINLGGTATQVSTGPSRTCALLSDGTIQCWGSNFSGALGNGNTTDSYTPVAVQGVTGAVSVSNGDSFSCALLNDGTVKCWGINGSGQLGDSTTTNRSTSVAVQGLGGVVTAIAVGLNHSCALLNDGTIKCWGSNNNGKLGDNSTTNRLTAVSVQNLGGVATAVQAGAEHTCALLNDGTVKCWGNNNEAQLGNNSFISTLIPVSVQNLGTSVTSIGLGYMQGCALLSTGSVKCWGASGVDTFGKKVMTNKLKATSSTSGLSATKIFSQRYEANGCAIVSGGSVKCWGDSYEGKLGNGASGFTVNQPITVLNLGLPAIDLSLGNSHGCAILNDGSMKCWGYSSSAQLWDGINSENFIPTAVQGLGESANAISAGDDFECAVLASGSIKCWGSNSFGSLGDGTLTSSHSPVSVANLSGTATAVVSGHLHSCALISNGSINCWGQNLYGGLGDNSTTDRRSAVSVSSLGGTATAMTAGDYHTCALMSDGTVKCWGRNNSGQLGDNTTTTRITPVTVQSLGGTAVAIKASSNKTCALLNDSTVKCWGDNSYGQLGNNSMASIVKLPVSVQGLSGETVSDISNNCALISGGEVKCWGYPNGRPQAADEGVVLTAAAVTMPSIVKTTQGRIRIATPGNSIGSCSGTIVCKPFYVYALTSNGGLASPLINDQVFDMTRISSMDYGSYNFYLNDQCTQVTSTYTMPAGSSYGKFYALPAECSSGRSKITVTPHDSGIIIDDDIDANIYDQTPSGC